MQLTTKSNSRTIRVFISSTFSDMQAERDELIKFVFPQLRSLCDSRGVVWGEVDLRWGITDEEKAEGKVLPLCLEEIKNCRPYFIGLLGERYGWVPDDFPQGIIESEPWLEQYRSHSVTELEILHGVLNDTAMADHAFFYFRDPEYARNIPKEQKHLFEEELLPDDIRHFGLEQAEYRADQRKRKLQLLKDRIRRSGFPVRENYPDPKTLGELVLNDMHQVIDRLFPEGSAPDPLSRETDDHWLYAHAKSAVYLVRQEYYDALDAHAGSCGSLSLAVLGEAGSGKSALLSAWAIRYKEAYPDVLVIPHFIGATSSSSDSLVIMRRIMGELQTRFNLQEAVPDKPEEIIHAFGQLLEIAAGKGKVIIILDGLNQIDDSYSALDLVWIPENLPPNIRLIVSTLPGRPLVEITRREWKTLTVEPFTEGERRVFVQRYLKQYSKKLPDSFIDEIARASQTSSPIFIKTLLEELRISGNHQTLSRKLEVYLGANTVEELYERILERYEQDYDRERSGLVRDALTSIAAARYGLSEKELLEILGDGSLPIPHAVWAPLFQATREMLTNSTGLLAISHQNFKYAIGKRYLNDSVKKQYAHSRLADYFRGKHIGGRKVDELPFQLASAGRLNELHEFAVDLEAFNFLYRNDKYGLIHIWETLSSEYDAEKSYKKYLSLHAEESWYTKDNLNTLNNIGAFLYDLGIYSAAKEFFEKIEHSRNDTNSSDNYFWSSVYNNLGAIHEVCKDDVNAKMYYQKAIEMSEAGHMAVSGIYHNNLANICYRLGEQIDAEQHYLKAIELFEAQYGQNNVLVASCMSSISSLLISRSRSNAIAGKDITEIIELNPELIAKAERMAKNALHIKEVYYGRNHIEIVGVMNVLADIYTQEEKYEEAQDLLTRSLTISKTIAGTNLHPMISTIDLLINLYAMKDDFVSAISACKESIRLKENLFGTEDPKTVSAVIKLEQMEKLKRDNLSSLFVEKYFSPLIHNHYIPVPFPFIKYVMSIVAIYFSVQMVNGSSSVILSILITTIITGAYTKTVYTYKQAKHERRSKNNEDV